ncbi:hypothetical protein H0H81_012083, partial [Sphagnurus paluster]
MTEARATTRPRRQQLYVANPSSDNSDEEEENEEEGGMGASPLSPEATPLGARVVQTAPLGRNVLIVVTTDSDWYVTVDISGAENAAVVRELIFNKLNIQDDDQLRFSIYQTEMGAFAIGDALSDERLFGLCRSQGDSKASLKFFVSHSSAPVHESPHRAHSPSAVSVPPPILPPPPPPSAPLRAPPRHRTSVSADHPHETNAGYEADLDNPDRPHYPLPSPPQPLPSSPRNLRRSNVPRTTTPPPDVRHFTMPPPLSPNRASFLPDRSRPLNNRLRTEPSDAYPYKDSRRRRNPDDRLVGGSDNWVMVSPEMVSPPSRGPRPPQPLQRHQKIISPSSGRPLAIPNAPRHPPPVPVASELRASAHRPAGVPIPHRYFAWRGEERGATSSSASSWSRLTKGTKSMDNLRAAAFNHPATLLPGGARRAPQQLPVSPQPPPVPSYLPGLPRSYEPKPPSRPLPTRQPFLGPSAVASPSHDPYPRPTSALGDSHLQSPTDHDVRSPRGVSPARPYRSKLESSYGNRSDRSSDPQSGAETSYTTPPRTPISPRSPLYPGRDKNVGSSRPSTADSKPPEPHRGEPTLRPEDQTWFSSESTLIPSRAPVQEPLRRLESPPPPSDMSPATFLNQFEPESDSGNDDLGTTIWKKRPTTQVERPKSILRPPLKVKIDTEGSEQQEKQQEKPSAHPTFVSPPGPSRRPITPPKSSLQRRVKGERLSRGSTFTNRQSSTWAPRPRPEDVYERLEEFFPEHDLDKPVIEANSGGTSPTSAEPTVLAPPAPAPHSRMRNKKSIRLVAEEHKKLIDRTSRAESTTYSNVVRKRSTKLWGSKLEEVTAGQAQMQSNQSTPDSPSGAPTFKWVRGELIGRGTYGRVYLALNATTGEMIAVKQVELPQTASDKNDSRQHTVVQALKMESETLKDLDHPNIVQYLGFEETPDNLSIFLEYVPGGSVGSRLLKHGKFDENVTKSFTGQILSGLEYLHSKGILHR